MSTIECDACGVKWEEHKGIAWTCDDLQKFKKLTYQLCFALLDNTTNFNTKTLRIGAVMNAIREIDQESYDREVGNPCGLT